MLIRRRLGTLKSLVSEYNLTVSVEQVTSSSKLSDPVTGVLHKWLVAVKLGAKRMTGSKWCVAKGWNGCHPLWWQTLSYPHRLWTHPLCNLVIICTERPGKCSSTAIVRLLQTRNTGEDFGQQRLLQQASKPMSARIEARRWLQCAYVPLDNSITEISHRSLKRIAAWKLCITVSTRTGFEQRQLTQTFGGHMMCGIPSGWNPYIIDVPSASSVGKWIMWSVNNLSWSMESHVAYLISTLLWRWYIQRPLKVMSRLATNYQ